jgi:hypothetical protein
VTRFSILAVGATIAPPTRPDSTSPDIPEN